MAESDRSYDISQHIYERILEEQSGEPLQLFSARVALAAAMFRTGQTADAVNAVDQLDREDLPAPLRAQVELLSLYREVTMGQGGQHLDRAEMRRELFRRHLGTRAGYGYALLAAAFEHAAQPQVATKYWSDATLLVQPADLTWRYPETEHMATKYGAEERPL
jgi:hypothetical protein